ncbi:MAG: lipase [Candidatus Eremiobacteraeota bacterium]|nr:lipase [Candidatus Eremiobacteraeota bacterium]MBC5826646.1 lipase [Candidatus Eremiobacteraeota bacterium]
MKDSIIKVMFAAVFVTILIPCSAPHAAASTPAFGPPGSLVNFQRIAAPPHASAWRVRYVSTGLDGKPIEVGGVVIAPDSPGQNRAVVGYAHGTTGITDACAPSARDPKFKLMTGLEDMIAHGLVVAATDYPGLGTEGVHPYLVGISEGRAVLDSVRAARHIAAARASARFIPWGYSQGGHASLFAGQLASSYAPELKLVGIGAGAPPTDLYETIKFHIDQNRNKILAAYLLASWSDVYRLPLDRVLDSRSMRVLRLAARTCLITKFDTIVAAFHNLNLGNKFLNERMHQNEAWNKRFQDNAPGITPATPYFIAQGLTDTIVPPQDTVRYVKRACAGGDRVDYAPLAGMGHLTADPDAAKLAVAWMTQRFEEKSAPSNCGSLP